MGPVVAQSAGYCFVAPSGSITHWVPSARNILWYWMVTVAAAESNDLTKATRLLWRQRSPISGYTDVSVTHAESCGHSPYALQSGLPMMVSGW